MSFMVWISVHTGFIIPDPPRIIINTKIELRDVMYGCKELKTKDPIKWIKICKNKDEEKLEEHERGVVALYNHDTKTIHLPKKFDHRIPSHKSILLHELVHHMQYANGYNEKVHCMQLLEAQAYDLQEKWLKDNNIVLDKEFEIGPILRSLVTTCSHFYAPDLYSN